MAAGDVQKVDAGREVTGQNPYWQPNWTQDQTGRENTSPEFLRIVAHVERLIRNSAHDLIAGRADTVARLIVAQLAHDQGMAPATNKAVES